MREVTLHINGKSFGAEVEPRMHLADFLREKQSFTGTHIGCEHGVCGACTVLVDGVPARSCITFAVACDGAEITTIEGLDDDPVAAKLREAFSAEHALQCGYCTPGMLISARDIVTRLPDADEKRIRLELSGNLCRCTGYVGIVKAISGVLGDVKKSKTAQPALRAKLGPAGAHPRAEPEYLAGSLVLDRPSGQPAQTITSLADEDWAGVERDGVALNQSFEVAHDRDLVWRFFADLDQVARCIPGARLLDQPGQGPAKGEINVKIGPMMAAFSGLVEVVRQDGDHTGVVRGAGRDANSASRARGVITYVVSERDGGSSRVDIAVRFLLAGALAQFSRSGLVKDIADQLAGTFAKNLETRLSGGEIEDSRGALNASALARAALWQRIKRVFSKLLGR